jgi:site-specific DNA recombinase
MAILAPQTPPRRPKLRPAPDPRQGVIYLRVSTGLQERHGYGLDTQERECRALAAREGITLIAEPIRDVDSGTEYDLPGVHRLLDLAEQGAIGTAIIYDPDRLSRSLSKYVWIDKELTAAGVQAHYVTVGAARNEDEKLFHDMKAVFAQWDHRRIVRRMASGKRDKAAAGFIVGTGEAPYGYRYLRNDRGKQYALAIVEERARIVHRLFRDVTRLSLRTICTQLNAEGVPTLRHDRRPPRRGAPKAGWYPATVLGILQNPVYLGRAPYGRRAGKAKTPVADESQWVFSEAPAIVTQVEWDDAHQALDRRRVLRVRRGRTDPEADPYELRSLLTCGHCGGALACEIVRNRYDRPYRYYKCLRAKAYWAKAHDRERCPQADVPAPALEAVAWANVADSLLDPDKLHAGLAAAQADYHHAHGRRVDQLAALDRDIAARRGRLSRILDEQLDAPTGSETARLLAVKAQEIERQLARLQADRAERAAAPHAGLSDAQVLTLTEFAAQVRAGIPAATPAERRQIFELLGLKGTVRRDDTDGLRLSQTHGFRVDWDGLIPVRCNDREFVNVKTVHLTDASGTLTGDVRIVPAGE